MNKTLRFFNNYGDNFDKNGNKYYMLLVENGEGKTIISKFVKCNNALEMNQTLDLIRNDRLLVVEYLMRNENKYIDTLVADLNKIVKEFFDNEKNERLKTLLYNAIVLLEDICEIDNTNLDCLLDDIGMTSEEYDEIMGE